MWYVIQTSERSEEEICARCANAFPDGLCTRLFVPKYRRMYREKGEWLEITRVLFPGYFFAETEHPEEVRGILQDTLSRIAHPVCVGEEFTPIYPWEQEFLEEMMDAEYTIPISRGDVIAGESIIREGPLRGRKDIICHIDRHKRMAECRMSLHGMEKRVKIGLILYTRAAEGEPLEARVS